MSDRFYDEFYRQRRNLILISVVLFFVLSSGLSLQKIDVWGNEFDIRNPDGILTFLWVVWAYWVWRFWVYALEYKDGFFLILKNEVSSLYRCQFEKFYEDNGYYLYEEKFGFQGCKLVFLSRVQVLLQKRNEKVESISGTKFFMFIFPIFVRLSISHKSFTDQILPFLISLFPIALIIWTKYIFG